MRRNSLPAILLSVLAILACGALGAYAGFSLVHWIGLSGTPAAIVAVFAGMVVATSTFALGAALLRKLGGLQ